MTQHSIRNHRGPNDRISKTKLSLILSLLVLLFFALNNMFLISSPASSNVTPKDPTVPSFPLIISSKYDSNSHIDMLEEHDGIYHKDKSSTWEGNENFNTITEFDEWMLVNAFVQEGDVVIEFGARFGTTSCILSRNVGNAGHVISVEPDIAVHGYLLRNQHRHRCNFHSVLGTVSKKPLYMESNKGYATTTTTEAKADMNPLPYTDVTTIEKAIGKRINVALIDCEGCIPSVQESGLLNAETGVDVIIIEEDMIDYKPWHKKLTQQGYKCAWYLKDTSMPRRQWVLDMRHSTWVHKRVEHERIYPSCKDYVESRGYNSTQIDCAECPAVEL